MPVKCTLACLHASVCVHVCPSACVCARARMCVCMCVCFFTFQSVSLSSPYACTLAYGAYVHAYRHMCIDKCLDLCVDTCIHMCLDMCVWRSCLQGTKSKLQIPLRILRLSQSLAARKCWHQQVVAPKQVFAPNKCWHQ